MNGATKGYPVHDLDSPEGQAELARRGLTAAELAHGIALFEQTEERRMGTFIGISKDGVLGAEPEQWHPAQPDAFARPLLLIPWVQILELLGRVPEGSTEQMLKGKLPPN